MLLFKVKLKIPCLNVFTQSHICLRLKLSTANRNGASQEDCTTDGRIDELLFIMF